MSSESSASIEMGWSSGMSSRVSGGNGMMSSGMSGNSERIGGSGNSGISERGMMIGRVG